MHQTDCHCHGYFRTCDLSSYFNSLQTVLPDTQGVLKMTDTKMMDHQNY